GVWRQALKSVIKGEDFKDTEDPTLEELSLQFTKLLHIAQDGQKGEYQDDFNILGGYNEIIDSRDGNTAFRVAASYAYQSQLKFLNVKQFL
ncbi:hypothetical protein GIB67_032616, partial [Kingdonia uniflora]